MAYWLGLENDFLVYIAYLHVDCVIFSACILLKDEPDYEKVVTYCDKVLVINPRNAKALYRKGCALYHLGAHEAAYQSLIKAQQISKSGIGSETTRM